MSERETGRQRKSNMRLKKGKIKKQMGETEKRR